MSSILRAPRLLAAVCAAALLVACGGKNAETSLATAKQHLASGDLQAAVIELKNSLQADPNSAEARFLLGKALLAREDYGNALLELRKAEELKYDPEEVAPRIAQAAVGAGDLRRVIELDQTTVLTGAEPRAELKTQLAIARLLEGNGAKSEESLGEALVAKPDHAPALLLKARQHGDKREMAAARAIVDGILKQQPSNQEALLLLGQLLEAQGDQAGAVEQYRRAIAAKPDFVPSHAALLEAQFGKRDLEAARQQLDALKQARPTHLQTKYYEARFAAEKGDLKSADEQVQALLKLSPDSPQLLDLAAQVALRRNDRLQAEKHLQQLIQAMPRALPPRHVLATMYLRSNEPDKVMEVLQPALEASSVDARTLTLAGRAMLLMGDTRRASDAFTRASRLAPADPGVRTSLAVAKLSAGDGRAMNELEAIAAAERGFGADMVLVLSNLDAGKYDAALKAADRLATKVPDKGEPQLLRGRILARLGNAAASRAAYEQALKVEPNYFPAVQALVALDIRDRKYDQARERLVAQLQAQPKYPPALIALASLDESRGKPREEIVAALRKAVAETPTSLALRRHLIGYHLRLGDTRAASAAAQEATSAFPGSTEALMLLGQVQRASKEPGAAAATFAKVLAQQPRSLPALLALVDAQVEDHAIAEAEETMKKALALAPDSELVQTRAAQIEVLAGRSDDALARARSLQTRLPKSAVGHEIEGYVEARRSNWRAAAVAYQAALAKVPSSLTAERLHIVLVSAGEGARARAMADDWRKAHPSDNRFLFYLTSHALRGGDYAEAESLLRRILQAEPDHVGALNNMAWVLAKQQKPGALEMAERANSLLPNQPPVLDTMAMILGGQGKFDEAIKLAKTAVALDPTASAYRVQLARLYLQSGDKANARTALESLPAMSDRSALGQEVRKLRAEL